MDTSKFIKGTLAGTVASFVAAYLIFGLALSNYMSSNTMAGVGRDMPDFLWVVIAHLLFSAAVTYIFLKWAGIHTAGEGAAGGLIIGLLIALAMSALTYGTSNMYNGIAPMLLEGVMGGVIWMVGGAAVGWALGLGPQVSRSKTSPPPTPPGGGN